MHTLEEPKRFSQSLIWQLQRDYFQQAGMDAWRQGTVPHYITSNPMMGKTYAELVLACLRDLAQRGQQDETVYLVELGAGHGRLCYHFFKHFEKYYADSAMPLPPFCYVLTDFTESTLHFWQNHPRLQPYFDQGWLDFALFDAESSDTLWLQTSQQTLNVASLGQPLLVIANYFFDTIPQDLFRIEAHKIAHSLLSLTTPADPADLEVADLIDTLQLRYDYTEATPPIYPEPVFNELLAQYQQQLASTHLLFPHVGLRCLARLQQLSRQGVILLSADKGEHHLSNLDNCGAPTLATHGSFSLPVNYHALGEYCTRQGGQALFPHHQPAHLDVGCLLLVADAPTYRRTPPRLRTLCQRLRAR